MLPVFYRSIHSVDYQNCKLTFWNTFDHTLRLCDRRDFLTAASKPLSGRNAFFGSLFF